MAASNASVGGSAYRQMLHQLASLSARAPRGRLPKNYNAHKFVSSPFPPASPDSLESHRLHFLPIQRASEAFDANVPPSQGTSPWADNVPLPAVIQRHLDRPSAFLEKGSAIGKITGYRIEVNGKRGTRSVKQVVSYGKLDQGSFGSSLVDFGKAIMVGPKGVTGVKVWVGYAQ